MGAILARDWLTAADIHALSDGSPALPTSLSKLQEMIEREGWSQDRRRCRNRFGPGGGREFHVTLLPSELQARLSAQEASDAADRAYVPDAPAGAQQALWAEFMRLPEKARLTAVQRLAAIEAVERYDFSTSRYVAVALVANAFKISMSTLWDWLGRVADRPKADRLPLLAPRHAGRTVTAPCDVRAWDCLVAGYLRPEAPNFEAAYRVMMEVAQAEAWSPIPSAKTLKRRLEREYPRTLRTLARSGNEAAARIFPHQTRDRSHFHALEAVNADGHKLDIFCRWEDGSTGRPILTVFQDLYSGVILSCRIDRSENREVVRLAFADLITNWGIPDKLWLDNGRHFASKWMTGRMKTRYRFKIKDEEPQGLFTALVGGNDVHFTTPYHGQSKPIERAFRDFCTDIAKHPAFAGAYTGNTVLAKPDNYGSKAIPIEIVRAVVAKGIIEHNARPGRRGGVAAGRSFLQTLRESIAESGTLVRRATSEQRRMMLMAAEGVTARKPTGEIQLEGTRYWADELPDHIGRKLVVRFDPQDLAQPVGVYTLDGRWICEAEPIGAVQFNDIQAAREWAGQKRAFLRAQRDLLERQQRITIDQLAAMLPDAPKPEPVRAKVVGMVRAGGRQAAREWGGMDAFAAGVDRLDRGELIPFRREEAND